jgi:hypothetical protein
VSANLPPALTQGQSVLNDYGLNFYLIDIQYLTISGAKDAVYNSPEPA